MESGHTIGIIKTEYDDFIKSIFLIYLSKCLTKFQKVQKPFPETHQFFCDPNGPGKRSRSIPISVHELRPGDIDIIAAMGDSLTAGNGALATNVLQVFIENKGVSWSIGGQSKWQKYLTLPNIIKVFNPNLYGYSLSDGYSTDKRSRLVHSNHKLRFHFGNSLVTELLKIIDSILQKLELCRGIYHMRLRFW